MSLKRRLARLPTSGSATSRPIASEAPAQPPVDATTSAPTPRDQVLRELRERMQSLLGNDASVETEVPPDLPELGFDQLLLMPQENAAGQFWIGRKRLAPSEHVGRLCVTGADEADAQRLSLLALDPELGHVDLGRALYLDTETTGLGGAGVFAFVVGLGFFEAGHFVVEQLVLEGPEQEAASLLHLRERVEASDVLVSFNGKSFDWPLLKGRYVMNRLPAPPEKRHLDLLHLARRVHKERLSRCKLTSLENEVLGFERHGDIDGAEVCSRYLHFLRTRDASGLQAILDHNHWDVISMAALVSLYGEERPALTGEDFVGIANTLKRARRFDQARNAANVAISEGVGAKALRTRAEIQKALGEKHAALADFEQAYALEPSPALRLELAKLYEHLTKQPARALDLVEQGTGEKQPALTRRRIRLQRKARRLT